MTNNALRDFAKSCVAQSDLLPVWQPGSAIEVGDVGVVKDGIWESLTTIHELGASLKTSKREVRVDYRLHEAKTTSMEFHADAKGKVPSILDGHSGVSFEFHGAGAFALIAPQCTRTDVSNLLAAQKAIDSLRHAGRWKLEWAFVTTVVEAPSAAVVVAGQDGGKASLDLGASLTPNDYLNLSAFGAGAGFTFQHGIEGAYMVHDPSPVLFKAYRAYLDFWTSDTKFQAVKGGQAGFVDPRDTPIYLKPLESLFD